MLNLSLTAINNNTEVKEKYKLNTKKKFFHTYQKDIINFECVRKI